ncbi:MAG: cation:proton antiporter [Spirochaetota bacterium]|nr:cation:proton antiporter [Spirochaetota bacterium]
MSEAPAFSILALSILFLLALFIGRMITHIRLPRVTGYLLTGIIAGPSLAGWLDIPPIIGAMALEKFHVISEVALVLILLSIGMRFRVEFLQRWRSRILVFSLTEIIITCLTVFVLVIIVNQFYISQIIDISNLDNISSFNIAVFLSILAIATAPAATLLVIREYESEGPVTDAVTTLVGINNLVTIIVFNIAVSFMHSSDISLNNLLLPIFVPILTGGTIGFIMSIWAQRLEQDQEFQLLILGGSISVWGICNLLGYDFLLGSFACGLILVNSSPKSERIFNATKQFDYALYVVFFVLAGASFHLDDLPHIGILGIIYIFGRIIGKLLGCRIGAVMGRFSTIEQKWIGFAMLSQAGVAIGLCNSLSSMGAPGEEIISTVVLGSVVVFELIGPISVRFGLVRAGEVPLLTLLAKKASIGSFEVLFQVINYFRSSIGIPKGHNVDNAEEILVKHIMRTNVNTIRDNTPFEELLHFISHSRYDRFPIVDKEGNFVGVIDYSDIRNIIFNPILSNLVLAVDLVKEVSLVTYPDKTVSDVLDIFKKHKDISYLPVVEESSPDKLLGIICQNDVLAVFRKK